MFNFNDFELLKKRVRFARHQTGDCCSVLSALVISSFMGRAHFYTQAAANNKQFAILLFHEAQTSRHEAKLRALE